MENMGRQKLVDKTVLPQEVGALQTLAGLNVAQALQQRLGTFLIGGYKGQSVFVDLDKLVNEPLALVEGIYALDKIDARDAITATLPLGAPIGTVITAALTVPAGELWIVEQVTLEGDAPAAAEEVHANFRIGFWQFSDIRGGAVVNNAGRLYLPADVVADDTPTDIDETIVFGAVTELGTPLRLSGGSVLTLVTTQAGAVAAAANAVVLTPFGRKIRRLVA